MTGSYTHLVDAKGGLERGPVILDLLDHPEDMYEAIQQLYGMIWYLAEQLSRNGFFPTAADAVSEAKEFYKEGLQVSPSDRYRGNG
jgi:hypothetical protein